MTQQNYRLDFNENVSSNDQMLSYIEAYRNKINKVAYNIINDNLLINLENNDLNYLTKKETFFIPYLDGCICKFMAIKLSKSLKKK